MKKKRHKRPVKKVQRAVERPKKKRSANPLDIRKHQAFNEVFRLLNQHARDTNPHTFADQSALVSAVFKHQKDKERRLRRISQEPLNGQSDYYAGLEYPNPTDAGTNYYSLRRENGRLGSYPSADRYDDESTS